MRATGMHSASAPEQPSSAVPNRLLWFAGIAACSFSIIAFVLWAINGAGILLDMMVALCT